MMRWYRRRYELWIWGLLVALWAVGCTAGKRGLVLDEVYPTVPSGEFTGTVEVPLSVTVRTSAKQPRVQPRFENLEETVLRGTVHAVRSSGAFTVTTSSPNTLELDVQDLDISVKANPGGTVFTTLAILHELPGIGLGLAGIIKQDAALGFSGLGLFVTGLILQGISSAFKDKVEASFGVRATMFQNGQPIWRTKERVSRIERQAGWNQRNNQYRDMLGSSIHQAISRVASPALHSLVGSSRQANGYQVEGASQPSLPNRLGSWPHEGGSVVEPSESVGVAEATGQATLQPAAESEDLCLDFLVEILREGVGAQDGVGDEKALFAKCRYALIDPSKVAFVKCLRLIGSDNFRASACLKLL